MKFIFGLIFLVVIFSVNGRYADYEENIPELHGKFIRFNEKMGYVILTETDSHFIEEERKYRYSLNSFKNLREDAEYARYTNSIEEIRKGMRFKIISSFWERGYGFKSIFQDNYRFVVIRDEDGITSTIYRASLMILDFEWV